MRGFDQRDMADGRQCLSSHLTLYVYVNCDFFVVMYLLPVCAITGVSTGLEHKGYFQFMSQIASCILLKLYFKNKREPFYTGTNIKNKSSLSRANKP
jgi:hypothetical protein